MEHKTRFLQFVLSSNKPISINNIYRSIEGKNQIIKILHLFKLRMHDKKFALHFTFHFGNNVKTHAKKHFHIFDGSIG